MPSLRQEITRTFRRLSRRSDGQRVAAEFAETVVRTDPREGQQLGAYRILKHLGAGGMGQVYLALDTRLGRHVALKFLPPDLVADSGMLRLLEEEARTASALNHPNILTIYEIGIVANEHFIASEYIDGPTLRTALQRGMIDPAAAIDIATQIASALAAAHAAGIVHRDLKPGNVIIRPDGLVKVIDFGLAKRAIDPERNDENASSSGAGHVPGTIEYMSPEQARGDEIDHRTDLWSLGVVIYETLAHRRPFEGQTDSHTIVAILDHPVPPLPDRPKDVAALARIAYRALAKDLSKRYQSATEMLGDLHSITHASGSRSAIRPLIPAQPASNGKFYAAAVAIVLLLTSGVVWWVNRGPDWFQIASVRQLTFNGRTSLAAISPDGNFLAFVVKEPGGPEALYLEDVKRGSEEIKLRQPNSSYKGVTFSPDGQTIYVSVKDEELMGRLYAVPLVGESPSAPLITDIDGPISFAPSGDEFAFVRFTPQSPKGQLLIGKPDHTEKVLVSKQSATLPLWVAWSPRRNLIAAFLSRSGASASAKSGKTLELVKPDGTPLTRALPEWSATEQPAWTPHGRTLIVPVATHRQALEQAQLKEIEVDSGQTHETTTDLAGYSSPSLSRDGNQLAAVKLELRAHLWVSTANDINTGEINAVEATDYRSLIWSDPDHLIIGSPRGGVVNLWAFDVLKQTRTNLTNEIYVERDAALVPRTKQVVFDSTNGGGSHIWKFDPDSNSYTQLSFGDSYDQFPSVSPDGNWIVYTAWNGNTAHLRKISINGGLSTQIGSYTATNPEISPDGQWIACQLQNPKTLQLSIAVIPVDGEGPVREFPKARVPFRWHPDGTALATVLPDERGVSNLWAIPLDGSTPRQLTHFGDESIFAFAWSSDGHRLACIRGALSRDAVVFEKRK